MFDDLDTDQNGEVHKDEAAAFFEEMAKTDPKIAKTLQADFNRYSDSYLVNYVKGDDKDSMNKYEMATMLVA